MFSTQAFVSPFDTTATQGFNIPLHESLPQDDITQTTPRIVKFVQLFKSIFFPKTFCTNIIPTFLSTDSWRQPFRFLTQVLFSMQSPTLQISAIMQHSKFTLLTQQVSQVRGSTVLSNACE
jgi:hypothetical protein